MFGDMLAEWKMFFYPLAVIFYLVFLRYLEKQSAMEDPPLTDAEYISKIARSKEESEYNVFHVCAEEWHVSDRKVEQDFKEYLLHGYIPYYVKDFIRKIRKEAG